MATNDDLALIDGFSEVTDDQTLDAQHAVEEAMSESDTYHVLLFLNVCVGRAMVRNCPQCSKPFVKQDGVRTSICIKL